MFSTGKKPKTPGRSTPGAYQGPRAGARVQGVNEPYKQGSASKGGVTLLQFPAKIQGHKESPVDFSGTPVASNLPIDVRDALQQSGSLSTGGFDQATGFAWVVSNPNLFLWKAIAGPLPSHSIELPLPSFLFPLQNPKTPPVVSLVEKPDGDVAVICASRSGVGAVFWPGVLGSGTGAGNSIPSVTLDPGLGSPEALPTSMAATRTSEGGALAVVGCADGTLWKLHCSGGHMSRAEIVGQRPGGSPAPVRTLEWAASKKGSEERSLLVLTSADVECWSVSVEKGGEDRLLWSFPMWGAVQQNMSKGHERVWLLDMALETSSQDSPIVSVLAASATPGEGSQVDQWIDRFTLDSASPEHLVRIGTLELPDGTRWSSEEALLRAKLRAGGRLLGSFLVTSGDGACSLYTPSATESSQLQPAKTFPPGGSLGPVLAASAAPHSGEWLLLTGKAGVVALKGEASFPRSGRVEGRRLDALQGGSDAFRTPAPLKSDTKMLDPILKPAEAEPGAEVPEIPEEVPDSKAEVQVTKQFIEYSSTGRLDGVLDILQRAGALDEAGRRNAFARASRSIVDALGKSWTTEGVNASLLIRGSLADKQERHALFLEFTSRLEAVDELQNSGALPLILEHSEKIASAVALREFQNAASDFAQQSAQGSFTPSETDPGQAILSIVRGAGESISKRQVALADRDSVEVFYTRVSNLESFFSSLTSHAAAACFFGAGQAPLRLQAERVCELMDASGRMIEAARRTRDEHANSFGPSTSLPWTSSAPVLDGLWTLWSLSSDAQTRAASSNPSLVPLVNQRLRSVGEILLDGHRDLLEAASQEGQQAEVLRARKTYASRRDALLRAQLQFVRGTAAVAASRAPSQQGEAEKTRALRMEYQYLSALAKKHGCFEVLTDVCEDLGDDERLREYMKADVTIASEGPFSRYVFERCLARKEESRLLRFGDQGFGKELGRFLEGRPQLRWLHEIGQKSFSDAADTLASISGHDNLGSLSEAHLRRQLCLEKMARLAAPRHESTEREVEALDRRIALLDLQVESGVSTGHPLPPARLIEELLKGDRAIVPAAFEALSLAGPAFVSENRALVERAWLRAASLDNWVAFQKAHVSEGWSDAMYLDELQKTVLCTAAGSLYAQDLGHAMATVMPLRSTESSSRAYTSVQAILSKHSSFQTASEAMLDAVAFGIRLNGEHETGQDASTMLVD